MGKSVVGDLLNFRGLVYAPINEQGVVFLFGKVVEDLNMYVEEMRREYPDCIARRYVGNGRWEELRVEFEFQSKGFQDHEHDPAQCDMIICWENNWPDCPLEVIELREAIKGMEPREVSRPDRATTEEGDAQALLRLMSPDIRPLYGRLHQDIVQIADGVYRKVGKTVFSYYSPQRVFCYCYPRQKKLRLEVFTRGETWPGTADFSKGWVGPWRVVYLEGKADVDPALEAMRRSHAARAAAIAHNEPTSWGLLRPREAAEADGPEGPEREQQV